MHRRILIALISLVLGFMVGAPADAQLYINTIAGGGSVGDGLLAIQAGLNYPADAVKDAAGNLYIADSANHRIRKVTPAGVITTIAGTGEAGFSGDGGPAQNAQLNSPLWVSVDGEGALYISDYRNYRLRVMNLNGSGTISVAGRTIPAGQIDTIAGNGEQPVANAPDGAPAPQVALSPAGIAVDLARQRIYLADTERDMIWTIARGDVNGTLTVFVNVSQACCYRGDGAPAADAGLRYPQQLALDTQGNLYVADVGSNRVRVVNTQDLAPITIAGVTIPPGYIDTIAGNGTDVDSGDNVPARATGLSPYGIAVRQSTGEIFISDVSSNRIRKIDSGTGIIQAFAGTGGIGFGGDSGQATDALFNYPLGLSLMGPDLVLADSGNNRVRVVNGSDVISTVAGSGYTALSGDDSLGYTAALGWPWDVKVKDDSFVVADTGNNRVFVVDANGTFTTLAGTGTAGFSGDAGPANLAQLDYPLGIAIDANGNVYVADSANQVVRFINRGAAAVTIGTVTVQPGQIATVAGSGEGGCDGFGGLATAAKLWWPYSLALGLNGELYISLGSQVLVFNPSVSGSITPYPGLSVGPGEIHVFAGVGPCDGISEQWSGDGGPARDAYLSGVGGIAVDTFGNVYVADIYNHAIRKVGTDGIIQTVAGSPVAGVSNFWLGGFSGDGGPATAADLNGPWGVAVDPSGNLFISDSGNNRIRKVDPSGTIATIAGDGLPAFGGDGGLATSAQIYYPGGLNLDSQGRLYLADSTNNRIRRIEPPNTPAGAGPIVVDAIPGVSLTFNNQVTTGGFLAVTTSETFLPPSDFELCNSTSPPACDAPPVFYTFSGVSFTGTVTVTIHYANQFADESNLVVSHRKDDGTIEVITGVTDPVANTFTFETASFSTIVVARKLTTPLPATVEIKPEKWNIKWGTKTGNGKVSALIGNLSGHSAREIDPASVRLNGTVPVAEKGKDHKLHAKVKKHRKGFEGPVLEVKFNKFDAFRSLGPVSVGQTVPVKVTGKLRDGTPFEGTDTVLIVGR